MTFFNSWSLHNDDQFSVSSIHVRVDDIHKFQAILVCFDLLRCPSHNRELERTKWSKKKLFSYLCDHGMLPCVRSLDLFSFIFLALFNTSLFRSSCRDHLHTDTRVCVRERARAREKKERREGVRRRRRKRWREERRQEKKRAEGRGDSIKREGGR